jgi:hypothetical protein
MMLIGGEVRVVLDWLVRGVQGDNNHIALMDLHPTGQQCLHCIDEVDARA